MSESASSVESGTNSEERADEPARLPDCLGVLLALRVFFALAGVLTAPDPSSLPFPFALLWTGVLDGGMLELLIDCFGVVSMTTSGSVSALAFPRARFGVVVGVVPDRAALLAFPCA